MVKHLRASREIPAFGNGIENVRCAKNLAQIKTSAAQSTGITEFSPFRCPMDMEAMA